MRILSFITATFVTFASSANGISDWQELWHKYCVHLNHEIKIKHNNNIINEGIFLGINADGSLNLKINDNEEIKYEHGEISIEGIY